MSSYYLILDESGGFEEKNRYIVIGGLLIKQGTNELEQLLNSIHKIKKILKIEELHSVDLGKNDKKVIKGMIFSKISEFEDIKSIVYVFDLQKTNILKQYNKEPYKCTKTSFKYNKAIDLLYRDLIRNCILTENDEIVIILDKIDLSESEQNNIKGWLHKWYDNVKEVILEDSKNSELVQVADLIVNSYPKKSKYDPQKIEFKLLNPFFEVFPRAYKHEYYLKK